MHLKNGFTITALLLILSEAFCAIYMPEFQESVLLGDNQTMVNLDYLPYLFASITASFIAFFTLLVGGVIIILKGTYKKYWLALTLLLIAFAFPLIYYRELM